MVKQEGVWTCEVTEVVLRKAKEDGIPYSAICTLKVVDKEVHVVGLLSKETLIRSDFLSIKDVAKSLGYEEVKYIKKGAI
tara:strand:- start:2389 stop:2628 length:240 start_codon:yes stop_codon:yes gene_type:complete